MLPPPPPWAMRIPDDIHIVGTAEADIRVITGLPIETIVLPYTEMGRQAIAMLKRRIDSACSDQTSLAIPAKLKHASDV